jgi:general secretion pathway protein A
VLTGDVGTGKTTLLQTLLQRLDANTAAAFVFNSTLPFDGILEYMLEDFGITKAGDTRAQRLFALNHFLIERRRAGQNTVLIIDEAQNLDPPTLEQIRLLSNFETPREKLLQIMLIGQPELKAKLQLPELRQLKQRIALRCTIPPLKPDEVREYIRFRLRVAGASDLGVFSDRAVLAIAEYAGGIPRVVNTVCDHCLLMGYADQKRRVEPDLVQQAITYLEEGEQPETDVPAWRDWRRGTRAVPWLVGALAFAAGLVVGGVGSDYLGGAASALGSVGSYLSHLIGR